MIYKVLIQTLKILNCITSAECIILHVSVCIPLKIYKILKQQAKLYNNANNDVYTY